MSQKTYKRAPSCPQCQNKIVVVYLSEEEMYQDRQVRCDCGWAGRYPGLKRPSPKPAATELDDSKNTTAPIAKPFIRSGDNEPNPAILRAVRNSISELHYMAESSSPQQLSESLTSILNQLAPLLDDSVKPVANAAILETMQGVSEGIESLQKLVESARKTTIQTLSTSATQAREAQEKSQANLAHQIGKLAQAQEAQVAESGRAAASAARQIAESIVGEAPLSRLEDRFREMLKQAFEQGLGESRELKIDDVLEVFDIFDRFRQFWTSGDDLTPEEAKARSQVVATFNDVHSRMERWAARQRLTTFPDLKAGPVAYQVESHRRVDTVKTPDSTLDGTIARVDLVGYNWKGRQLRRADVVVYKFVKDAGSEEASGHE